MTECAVILAGFITLIMFSEWVRRRYWLHGRDVSYRRYLVSAHWKDISRRVRMRDDYTCQDCGADGWVVHHLTYERLGRERMSDLVTLCMGCHAARHKAAKLSPPI